MSKTEIFADNEVRENNGAPFKNVTGTTQGTKRGLDFYTINQGQRSAYGVFEAVENLAYIRAEPSYDLIPSNFREFTDTGGSTEAINREFKASSGTSVGGYGAIQSFRSLNFEYGQSAICRVCARWPSPQALTWTGAGLISITDELSFGYNGLDFGVWHRYGGEAEVRTLQVTTGAGGSENATVTINGVAYTVPLTSGTVQANAREIANYLDANASGFAAEQIDDSVVVSALTDGAKSSTWSFTSSTAVAAFTRNTEGVTKTSVHTPQADFNGAVFTGFDPTKGNTYEISYTSGYGSIAYYIFDPNQREFILAHIVKIQSEFERPSLNNHSMRTAIYAASVGATTNVDTICAMLAAFSQGARNQIRNPRAFSNTKSVGTTATNVLTIRNKRIYNGKVNQSEIVPKLLTLASESSKNTIIEVRGNPTVAGTTNYQDIGTNLISETEIAGTTVTGGRLLVSIVLAGGNSAEIDFTKLGIRVPPTLNITISARVTGGASSDVTASLVWVEDI